eukprot:652770-Pleurochrysis_carterae.AAC.1
MYGSTQRACSYWEDGLGLIHQGLCAGLPKVVCCARCSVRTGNTIIVSNRNLHSNHALPVKCRPAR